MMTAVGHRGNDLTMINGYPPIASRIIVRTPSPTPTSGQSRERSTDCYRAALSITPSHWGGGGVKPGEIPRILG